MERCAVSIASNIAEGFGRQSTQDKKHFYIMARGSAYELQNQLIIARDTKKISQRVPGSSVNLSRFNSLTPWTNTLSNKETKC